MFAMPLLVALLSGDPTGPAPAATAAPPTPLTEIGRVRGRSMCASIVVHANAAIDGALDNDRTFGSLMARLSTAELDGVDEISRRKTLDEIDKNASRIRIQALNGEGEVRRLRELAAASTDDERKKELRSFADALGGALYRQRRAALDLQRMVVILAGRRAADEATITVLGERDTGAARISSEESRAYRSMPRRSYNENGSLREGASMIGERLPLIAVDEGTAADHAVGATTGC